MKSPQIYCQCCGRTLPDTQMRQLTPVAVCIHCAILSPVAAVELARDTSAREYAATHFTQTGRRQARVLAKLASYAVTGKRCGCCHQYKPVEGFNQCAPRPDGLQAACKACNKLRLTVIAQPNGAATWRAIRDAMRAQAAAQQSA